MQNGHKFFHSDIGFTLSVMVFKQWDINKCKASSGLKGVHALGFALFLLLGPRLHLKQWKLAYRLKEWISQTIFYIASANCPGSP